MYDWMHGRVIPPAGASGAAQPVSHIYCSAARCLKGAKQFSTASLACLLIKEFKKLNKNKEENQAEDGGGIL